MKRQKAAGGVVPLRCYGGLQALNSEINQSNSNIAESHIIKLNISLANISSTADMTKH